MRDNFPPERKQLIAGLAGLLPTAMNGRAVRRLAPAQNRSSVCGMFDQAEQGINETLDAKR